MKFIAKLAAIGLLAWAPVAADDKAKAKEPKAPKRYETTHKNTFGGQSVEYRAIAGETHLKDKKGEPIASIFSTTYLRTNVDRGDNRPVMFVFNGGPGSSSVWLHLGLYGPVRLVLPSDAEDDGSAPYDLRHNPLSPLDMVDMVFVDPVGTGYSRAIGKGKGKDFWGVTEDAQSLAEFIRLWLNEYGRWNSPKYLSGESYGTTRSAALLKELSGGWTDISVNGVLLISSILDFQTARFAPGNDTPYISYLPTMAATAWYHDKVNKEGRTLEGFLDEVREFTLGEYAHSLLLGNRISDEAFNIAAAKMAAYTGLDVDYIKRGNLRVTNMRFMKELLKDEGYSVGRLDSRFKGRDYDTLNDTFEADPSGYGIDSAYSAALNHYMRQTLTVDLEQRYEILSGEVFGPWKGIKTPGYTGGYVNVAPHIGRAMRQNKDFRAFVANGYYDLATPFFATENTFNANGIDTERSVFTYYEAGHMMYVHQPSIEALMKDVRDFFVAGP